MLIVFYNFNGTYLEISSQLGIIRRFHYLTDHFKNARILDDLVNLWCFFTIRHFLTNFGYESQLLNGIILLLSQEVEEILDSLALNQR